MRKLLPALALVLLAACSYVPTQEQAAQYLGYKQILLANPDMLLPMSTQRDSILHLLEEPSLAAIVREHHLNEQQTDSFLLMLSIYADGAKITHELEDVAGEMAKENAAASDSPAKDSVRVKK